jgi:hypothetical protein
MRTLRNTSNERRRKDLRPRAYQVSEPDKKIEDPMIYNSNDEFSRYFSYLIENNKKGVDDELPFFTSFPNIAGNYNLISLAERKVQEVLSAYDGGTIELNDDDPHYDIVTIIPYRGRYLHLKETVKSLISSANLVDKKIGFYVIENSSIKTAPSDILNFDNVKYRHINSKGKVFNK